MSYYTDIISSYIWTLLWRGQVLSYQVVFVLHNMFGGRNLLQHQLWNYRHIHWIATSAILLSFQVLYNLPYLSRQQQDTANRCPISIHRTCSHHKIWCKSCNTAPIFAVLRVEAWWSRKWLVLCVQSVLWRVQLHTMNCWHDLAFWTVYYWGPHVFFCQWGTSLQCVDSGPWSGKELLPRIFTVSLTTLEFGLSSPCILASTADCTKLLNHFLGVYSTKRRTCANKIPL